jgi:hypothetical protein
MSDDVPRLVHVQAGVHLATLALTEPGDVFYLAADPSQVWWYDPDYAQDGYAYCRTGSADSWCTRNEVGEPAARIVVLHNTRKACAPPTRVLSSDR